MKENNFFFLRQEMVTRQIISRGISSSRVIQAFLEVPRHEFVLEENIPCAYEDHPLPIGEGQTISQPYMVALMSECLELEGGEKVLEIGTGSGYQTAILAELAREVYTIERLPSLVERASLILKSLGYANIQIKLDDGSRGWKEFSPYERIIVTAASACIPPPLIEQLKKDNGRMVIPLGERHSQILTVLKKTKQRIETKEICGCVFVPLLGKYGGREEKI